MTGIELAIAATAASTLASVGGAVMQAQAQSKAANANAAIARRNAVITQQNAEFDERQFRRLSRQRQGSIRANIGGSGVAVEGSPLDLLAENEAQAEIEALMIRRSGFLESENFTLEAAVQSANARSATRGGFFGAGSALLLGGAKTGSLIGDRSLTA